MRRVLVPLDGSDLAETILPEAQRLAGPDGTLILIRRARRAAYDPVLGLATSSYAEGETYSYLESKMQTLRNRTSVEAHVLLTGHPAVGIDEAARAFRADMIACATHGRNPFGRILRGDVAWRALANSSVPVLLRHPDLDPAREPSVLVPDRILVPLDGSEFAERALPLAEELAIEWNAFLHLVRVVPAMPMFDTGFTVLDAVPQDYPEQLDEAMEYLDGVASLLSVRAQTEVRFGKITTELVRSVCEHHITHLVMTSQGRTGLTRVVMGSVADVLVHSLHLPILVIPSLAAEEIASIRDRAVQEGEAVREVEPVSS